MSKDYEFEINEQTLENILLLKNQMGYSEKTWDEWFFQIIDSLKKTTKEQSILENAFEKNHYKKNYENWVSYFALNLENIANEYSARELDPTFKTGNNLLDTSAIVIGAGPSVKKNKHLELLSSSNYKGSIICTDRMLEPVLKAGITPEKFPKFYVATIDPAELLKKFYQDPIITKFGNKINGIFSSVVHPNIVANARKAGIKIHWIHSLFDYNEGKKSFNQISGLMVRAKNHKDGLPAIQTGGNVGTACWFIAWKILKCNVIGLIGMNHGWDDDDNWDEILAHSNAPLNINRDSDEFKKLYPRIYNPDFDCFGIQDPTYQYYCNATKEFIKRSPKNLKTINATEGGSLFGERILSTTFKKFLEEYQK